jgi:hypothetical protein
MQPAAKKYLWIAAGIAVLAWILIEARNRNDFDIFLLAARDLQKGENIYTNIYFEGYHYYYSTLSALLLMPFTWLPLYLAKVLWLALNAFFAYRIWLICFSYIDTSRLRSKLSRLLVILSLLFVARFLRDNFHLAQMTICILYLSLEGTSQIDKGRNTRGAALIALAINIKLLPLVLVPYLFYRKEPIAGIKVIVFYAFFLILPGAFITREYNYFLIGQWWTLVNPTNTEHIIDVSERSFHSLSTLLPTLLMENVHENYALPVRRNIADLTVHQVNIILNAARLILAAFTLYFLGSLPFKKASSRFQKLWELSYIFLLVPLIFPHQQHYAFFFILPAVIYLLYFLLLQYQDNYASFAKGKFIIVTSLLAVIFLVCNSTLILGEFTAYYFHFKILTYGALLLIVPLAMCRPGYVREKRIEDQPL